MKTDVKANVPVANDVHARVTDINYRLRDVRNSLYRTISRVMDVGESEGQPKAMLISHTVIDKLQDAGECIGELEGLVARLEDFVGVASEDMPKTGVAGRALA